MSAFKTPDMYVVVSGNIGAIECDTLEDAIERAEAEARSDPDTEIHILETIRVCVAESVKPVKPPIRWLR